MGFFKLIWKGKGEKDVEKERSEENCLNEEQSSIEIEQIWFGSI